MISLKRNRKHSSDFFKFLLLFSITVIFIHFDFICNSGASSGIGAATAVLFSKLGASVAIVGRNEENLKQVFAECKNYGRKHLMIVADLVKEEDVKRILDNTISCFGQLNILVNCAGILAFGTIETTFLEQYDKVFGINVRSIYHLTMLPVPHLIATKENIINVSSVSGIRSFSGVLAYSMSKSALDKLTKCTALELASKQVRVNSVNPGVIITEIHKRAGLNDEAYAKYLERCKEIHALGRPGECDEVAKTIAFLASDESSFITEALIPVDGGKHVMCPR